jgi:TolA-binding protein
MRLSRLVLLGLLWSGAALGADRTTPDKLKDIDEEAADLRAAVNELSRNFSERSGFIGAAEARQRYEDAVYLFLIGEYQKAAMDFYILLNSHSLVKSELGRDVDWYLGECLFQTENYRSAAEFYRMILDVGPSHPFFSDAVRRSLEAFAILGDDLAFDSYYKSYIVTGKVKTTDLINYTLAKSFRLRGETARARSLFDAFVPTSEFYSRARYFLGVYYVSEGKLVEATGEFLKVDSVAVTSPEQQEVKELAELALGSLYYETGDFVKASEYYRKIPSTSALYPDQLFQGTWSLIKQELYTDALEQVDIFLVSFPDHRYAPAMQLLQGKLQMKLERYEEARVTFENLSQQYGPVVKRMGQLADGSLELRPYLNRALNETAPDPGGMPKYAIELIYSDPEVRRAVVAWQGVQDERSELEEAERSLREIDLALSNTGNSLGSFVTARNQLGQLRGGVMSLRARLLEAEGMWLRSRVPGESRPALVALLDSRERVLESMAVSTGQASQAGDRLQVYDEQVQQVQQRAFRLQQMVEESTAEATSTLEYLDSGRSKLPPDEVRKLRGQLEAQLTELADLKVSLSEAGSEAIRRKVMRTLETNNPKEDSGARSAVLVQIDNLRKQFGGYRRYATDADSVAFFAGIDRLWASADQLERDVSAVEGVIESSESREMAMVMEQLQIQRQRVAVLRADLTTSGANTEALAVSVLRGGMANARARFADDVLAADKGVVDVYWVRLQQADRDIDGLVSEKSRLLSELEAQYAIIDTNLSNNNGEAPQ